MASQRWLWCVWLLASACVGRSASGDRGPEAHLSTKSRGQGLSRPLWRGGASRRGALAPRSHSSRSALSPVRRPISGGAVSRPLEGTVARRHATPSTAMRVGFQGEPGAYSQKSAQQLLGGSVTTIGFESFEDVFRALASGRIDYAFLPFENSLGGSIHACYDLIMRYDVQIIAEHEFRVEHCLLGARGTKKADVRTAFSHPQALAQCDGYLRNLGIKPEPKYDTAGSAKELAERAARGEDVSTCAAIASDLAAEIFDMDVLESNIEDDDVNYTRFFLIARQGVGSLIPPDMPAKTSLVFLVPEGPGALYKALACFSLRDIDLSKLESRPTSPSLLQYVEFRNGNGGGRPSSPSSDAESGRDMSRFRYCFYLDMLENELSDGGQAAIYHLREQSQYVRVLGSYPRGSRLCGPVLAALEAMEREESLLTPAQRAAIAGGKGMVALDDGADEESGAGGKAAVNDLAPLKIGIIGFGKMGQYLARTLRKHADVWVADKDDMSEAANELGVPFYDLSDIKSFFGHAGSGPDVIVLAVSVLSFEEVLRALPPEELRGRLVTEVLNVMLHAKDAMVRMLPPEADLLLSHPMWGPESGTNSNWQGLPLVFERARVSNTERAQRYLSIFEHERCKMIEMSAEQHDEYASRAQFVTHLAGRVLGATELGLRPTPIDTAGYRSVQRLIATTCGDSFDLFFGLYRHYPGALDTLRIVRDALTDIERRLAAKEAYLAARAEITTAARDDVLSEVRALMREAVTPAIREGEGGLAASSLPRVLASPLSPPPPPPPTEEPAAEPTE